jgi:signal transduction histidine kinase
LEVKSSALPEIISTFLQAHELQVLLLVGIVHWLRDILVEEELLSQPNIQSKNNSKAKKLKELEDELRQMRALFKNVASLNATLSYERVLEMSLHLAMNVLENSNGNQAKITGMILLFEDDQLRVAASRGLSHAEQRIIINGRTGAVEQALRRGELLICENPGVDAELSRFLSLKQVNAAVIIPLVVGLEVYGLMVFGHPDPKYSNSDELQVLESIAQQGIVALQNARLYRDLELEKERITEIQESARKKLARDLHDGPTQSVGAIAMRVNFARRLLERDSKAASDELFKIEELARRTSKEIRQMLFTLRPLVLESEGLGAALNKLAEEMKENHDQNVIIEVDPAVDRDMEMGKKGVIFFIVEEAMNNARKHANANHIWIRLRQKGELAYLEIQDDGIGFDLKSVEDGYDKRGSMGMLNLRERTELVSGTIRIDTAPGSGTRLLVSIPLTEEAIERLHRPGFSG